MMNFTKISRYGLAGIVLGISVGNAGSVTTTYAQETGVTKPAAATKRVPPSGRDPFRKLEPVRLAKKGPTQVGTPSIQERIAQYKAHKVAAMNAHTTAPKPTTALLLEEMEIVGISRTPRGYAAIVEATPIKLSYVIYPGERFYDGQLVAIEESRLIFRREIVLSDGRRTRSVETKPLRQAGSINLMSSSTGGSKDPCGPEEQRALARLRKRETETGIPASEFDVANLPAGALLCRQAAADKRAASQDADSEKNSEQPLAAPKPE